MGKIRLFEPRKENNCEKHTSYDRFLAEKDTKVEIEHRIYKKFREFEQEAFISNVFIPDIKSGSEEVSRRKKKLGLNDQGWLKKVNQEELEDDISKIKQVTRDSTFYARIENKVLKTKGNAFKKNDRVKIVTSSTVENVVISWINSNEVTFRRNDGSKFKCTVSDISNGNIGIQKVRKV